ncbi:ABC transporter permease [Amycolatopsis nivea]|uniref:ABC transporter permease n=1 Tax=Amycolatopsis nivea TaxID=1644109 RepID=UPI00106F2022|nr:ABC transporter permease [Amycolatopsis nivea]
MRGSVLENGRILRCAAVSALTDMRSTYTWKSWTFAWLARILCQVTLFALIGRLLGSQSSLEYLVVGNSVYITADVVLLVVASTSWERLTGTFPLLASSPSDPFVVLVGRSVQWMLDGIACSSVCLLLLAPVLGVRLPVGAALLSVPIIVVVSISAYAFGLTIGMLALRFMPARNLIGRLASIMLMIVTGVQVPVAFWPGWVRAVSQVVPLTHGLQAVRDVLHGAGAGQVLPNVALELAVFAGWLLIAFLVCRRIFATGRRDGTIEFGG